MFCCAWLVCSMGLMIGTGMTEGMAPPNLGGSLAAVAYCWAAAKKMFPVVLLRRRLKPAYWSGVQLPKVTDSLPPWPKLGWVALLLIVRPDCCRLFCICFIMN